MRWVILVYISMFVPTHEVMNYNSYELSTKNYEECVDIARQLNDIQNAYKSNDPYVRSFYWTYNNIAHELKAECVYANPPASWPKWFNQSFNQPVQKLDKVEELNYARTKLRLIKTN